MNCGTSQIGWIMLGSLLLAGLAVSMKGSREAPAPATPSIQPAPPPPARAIPAIEVAAPLQVVVPDAPARQLPTSIAVSIPSAKPIALPRQWIEEILYGTNAVAAHAAVWEMANQMTLDDEACDALLDRLERIQQGPDEEKLNRTILWALSLRPDRVPVERVAATALFHPNPLLRKTALRTIGSCPSPWTDATLAKAAQADDCAGNRREAILFLALRLSPETFHGMALTALNQEPDASVRDAWRQTDRLLAPQNEIAAGPELARLQEKASL